MRIFPLIAAALLFAAPAFAEEAAIGANNQLSDAQLAEAPGSPSAAAAPSITTEAPSAPTPADAEMMKHGNHPPVMEPKAEEMKPAKPARHKTAHKKKSAKHKAKKKKKSKAKKHKTAHHSAKKSAPAGIEAKPMSAPEATPPQ